MTVLVLIVVGGFIAISLVCCVLALLISLFSKIYNFIRNRVIKKSNQVENNQSLTKQDIDNKIISMIADDFEEAGWTEWDISIHQADGQLQRIQRACDTASKIRLIKYNPNSGYAKMLGSSGKYYLVNSHRCSCPDFIKRGMPCKHMYYLAMTLPNYKIAIEIEDIYLPSHCVDNTLYGLSFVIVGQGQNKVKEYITLHGGTFVDKVRYASAIVNLSGKDTSKILEAKSLNMDIFTFEELQNLFTGTNDEQATLESEIELSLLVHLNNKELDTNKLSVYISADGTSANVYVEIEGNDKVLYVSVAYEIIQCISEISQNYPWHNNITLNIVTSTKSEEAISWITKDLCNGILADTVHNKFGEYTIDQLSDMYGYNINNANAPRH